MLQMIDSEELKTSTGKTFLKINYDPIENWIYTDWIGYPTPENVIKGAIAYLDTMRARKLTSVLNDNRNLVGRWDQSLKWVEEVWLPYARKSGLRYFAHVSSAEAMSAGAASIMKELIKEHITMQVFTNLEDAREWLLQHNN